MVSRETGSGSLIRCSDDPLDGRLAAREWISCHRTWMAGGAVLVFVFECTDGVAFAAERMLNGLPNSPAAIRWWRIQLIVRQPEQRADQLRTRQVIVHRSG